jgi:hypothetical protein
MIIRTYLPEEARLLAEQLEAPQELVRHHEMVCDALFEFMSPRRCMLQVLRTNFELALAGAAVHDMAKALYVDEISGPGMMHAELGAEVLLQAGAPPELAAFAKGHHQWNEESPIEHLLVALADSAWKGGRDEEAETELAARVFEAEGVRDWVAFSVIDEAMELAGRPGPARLEYQASGATPRGYMLDPQDPVVKGLHGVQGEQIVGGAANAFDDGQTDHPGGRGAGTGSPSGN